MRRAWPVPLLAVLLAVPCRATIVRVDVNGGGSPCGSYDNNYFGDPLLCDVYAGNVAPCANSLATNWGPGAFEDPGCDACRTPVEPTSWAKLKVPYQLTPAPGRPRSAGLIRSSSV